ncbi:uncharacterized protein N7479_005365 [Penicillium vulpinum]|uniref:Major facilitator superfamily (MFS) profile domain-containing protein n=1 Tax=Penicillium vulpinum TaxID=29845 RepID=A0A1V6RL06_9EURO|nr:uncharacterized protein N7479_005365 [Penicillium vulpinum]KAJ5958215.1 hypothetical protein N7479_005365 [Penicillium vulpinum]OQE02230.1 hypothetical protein PENVUL_c040G04266 [Penicillium vulpinum]
MSQAYPDEKVLDIDESHIEEIQTLPELTPAEKKRILRRVDCRLVIPLGIILCVSLLDRTNVSFAMVAGMDKDLHVVGSRYTIIIAVFFITYTILQPITTVILRKVGTRRFLPAITLAWGIVMLGSGFIQQWYELVIVRILLGCFEAGLFPGCAYLLSCWYPRYELNTRNAVFFIIGTTIAAFGGILSFGLAEMEGLGSGHNLGKIKKSGSGWTRSQGIAGWRWIFIIEGAITCAVALVAYAFIVEFPEDATKREWMSLPFLDEKEAAFIRSRIDADSQDLVIEPFYIKTYLGYALDLKIWGFATIFLCSSVQTYAMSYFLPIILKQMGFSTSASQYLVTPPYVFAAILIFTSGWLSDKYRIRSPFILFSACLGVIGIPLLGLSKNTGVRYFGAFLSTASANSIVPAVLTWQANNIRGQWKRAFCSATLIGAGGIGGTIGGTTFRSQDAPNYLPGTYTCIIASSLVIVVSLILVLHFHISNRRAAKFGQIIEGLEGFRYTL